MKRLCLVLALSALWSPAIPAYAEDFVDACYDIRKDVTEMRDALDDHEAMLTRRMHHAATSANFYAESIESSFRYYSAYMVYLVGLGELQKCEDGIQSSGLLWE